MRHGIFIQDATGHDTLLPADAFVTSTAPSVEIISHTEATKGFCSFVYHMHGIEIIARDYITLGSPGVARATITTRRVAHALKLGIRSAPSYKAFLYIYGLTSPCCDGASLFLAPHRACVGGLPSDGEERSEDIPGLFATSSIMSALTMA